MRGSVLSLLISLGHCEEPAKLLASETSSVGKRCVFRNDRRAAWGYSVIFVEVSVHTSYEYCCESYDVYCRLRDGVPPGDRPRTPYVEITSERGGDAVLDDDWDSGDLNDAVADHEEKRELLRQIRSFCKCSSEAQPRSFKEIIEFARRGCLATRALSSERRKVANIEEEVRKVIRELR